MNPKVFIIHASEDKERFVLDFDTKLRSKGIDTWIYERETYPGDSLVDKIFEEGIRNARTVIVVLSKYSIVKPWVREELNASVVKRIKEEIKLIPVVIDDCQVPACLQSLVWEKIKSLENYEEEIGRIVMSIFDQRDKPPIGRPPLYTQTEIDVLPDLTEVDSIVFKLSCEKAIEKAQSLIDTESILEQVSSLDIPQEEFFESLEILDRKGYIKAGRNAGVRGIPFFSITSYGFDKYARVYIDNYDSVLKSVVSQIVNHNKKDNSSISASLNQPQMIVDHFLEVLERKRLIKVVRHLGTPRIWDVSPELRRML
jgi:hypothetical protein